MNTPWLIFLSFAGAEWQAYRSLLRQGIEAYYPYFLDDARRGRWAQPVGKPQFPGYLFGHLSPSGIEDVIRVSPGVRAVLRNEHRIVELTGDQFSTINRRCEIAYRQGLPKADPIRILHVGELIAIPSGPLKNAPAIIKSLDKSGRIEVDCGQFRVSFHRSELAAADAESVRGRYETWPRAAARD